MIEAGTVLQDRYLINKQIGAGGMGTVYIATDQRFGSTVAVKETIFTDANLRKAFAREAQLLNSLRHPALPRVSDHFEEGSGQFLVMEYIAGDDLAEKLDLKKNGFAVAEVLLWAEQLLDALDYLHTQQRPVIHRDIKPQNLKLTPRGDIVLLDFGLAKGTTNETASVSITKSVFGYSRNYAPLEQIQGTGTGTQSDLYSLGATLYHLLTGSPPLDALTRATTVINNSDDPLKLASDTNPKIPVEIAEIINRAMSLNSAARFDTASEMKRALQAAKESAQIVTAEAGSHVFTAFDKNTEIMNGGAATDAPVSTADALATQTTGKKSGTGDNATNNNPATTAGKPAAATNLHAEATNVDNAVNGGTGTGAISVQIPVENASTTKRKRPFGRQDSFVDIDSPRQSPVGRIFAIAAVIVVLCGGGLAAWYATSGARSSSEPTAYGANTANSQKSGLDDKTKSSNASATVTVNQSSDSQISSPKDSTMTGSSGAKTVTVTETPSSGGLDKVESDTSVQNQRPKQVPVEIPLPEKEGAGTEDKPNVDTNAPEEESDEQSPDLRNASPEEREKMRLQIKRRKAEELRRRIEEQLRRKQQRREQNLPDEEPQRENSNQN